MRVSKLLEYNPNPAAVLIAAVASILLIGVVDFVTGYEVSMFIFYAVPILATGWFAPKKSAVLIALVAGLIWWWADRLCLHPYRWGWLQGYETAVRITFFLFVAYSGAALRAYRDALAHRIELLEHANRLEQEIVNITEKEQKRIGYDLHDGICQYLTALRYSAQSLEKDLQRAGHAKWAGSVRDLVDRLKISVKQTHDLARGLAPIEMDEAGLVPALEQLVTSTGRAFAVDCLFEADPSVRIPSYPVAMHLYRIIQEAITNAAKHSQARQMEISLRDSPEVLDVRVEDDGIGFNPAGASGTGMGLKIMNYRARSIGADLQINPRPSGGTVVRCTVPQQVVNLQPEGLTV